MTTTTTKKNIMFAFKIEANDLKWILDLNILIPDKKIVIEIC